MHSLHPHREFNLQSFPPITMAMAPTVDPFAVEDPSELEDWHVPVSFMKSRHSEKIRAEPPPEEAWRMKDRVSGAESSFPGSPLPFGFCAMRAAEGEGGAKENNLIGERVIREIAPLFHDIVSPNFVS